MDLVKCILAVFVFVIFMMIALPFLFISAVCYVIGYPGSLMAKGLGKIRDKVMDYLLA